MNRARNIQIGPVLGVIGRGSMIRPRTNRRPTLLVSQELIALATQFHHAGSDDREVIGSSGSRHGSSILSVGTDSFCRCLW